MRGAISGLLLVAAVTAQPAAALPSQYYQRSVYKACSGGLVCEAAFPRVGADRTLTVNHASCRVYLSSRTATVSHVQLQSDKNDGIFFLGLTPISNPNGRTFTAQLGSGPVAISALGRPRIVLYASNGSSGTVSIECGIAGRLSPVQPTVAPAAQAAEAAAEEP
jgi:hypothetical protein